MSIKRIHGISDTTPIVKAMQTVLYLELRKHFMYKNSLGNKDGWWRSNFWREKVWKKTRPGNLTATQGEVLVGSYELAHKISGGPIKPKSPNVTLAIPLCSDAKKLIRPALVRGDKRYVFQPLNQGPIRGIIFRLDKTKRPSKKKSGDAPKNLGDLRGNKQAKLSSKQGKIQKTAFWLLKTSVNQQADPTAEPKQADVNAAVMEAARKATLRAFRQEQAIPEF
jgi:hypothetical protein